MHSYESYSTSRTNWFDLPGATWLLSEPEQLKGFDSINTILSDKKEPLEAVFWKHSHNPSPLNIHWTEAAKEGRGLSINNPVFRQHGTEYIVLHFGLFTLCDPGETGDCEGYHCLGISSTIGHAPAAAATVKLVVLILMVITTVTPTHSDINQYNWHL